MGDDDKKKKEEKKKAEDDGEDDRVEFLLAYLTKSFRLKQEKWNKMIQVAENVKIIMNFLNNPNQRMLIMTIPPTGLLTPFTNFNAQIKQKFSYFLRKKKEVITMKNFRDVLTFGDMAAKPVEELAVIMEGIFVPVLSNPGNQKGWPKVVADDVTGHVRAFNNTVEQIRGAMRSQTILPMPQDMASVFMAVQTMNMSEGEYVNLQLKSSLENAVMKWSLICNDVLKQAPIINFANKANPVPRTEIEFWNARNKNLESIYDQLLDPRVKKMGEFLELTNSAYNSTFKTLFKNIVAALVEARDICLYLKTFVPHMANFEDNEFLEGKPFIKPLVHCIGLIWANSKYYSTNEKIVIFLKMVGNMLIESADKCLDPGNIFQGDPEEVYEKLQMSIDLLNNFQESFEYVRENLESYYKTPEVAEEVEESEEPTDEKEPVVTVVKKAWTFHKRNVFQRLMDFVDRLSLVKLLIATQLDFSKLEKVEIGGIKGRGLSAKCQDVLEEFNKAYTKLVNITYEILDLSDNRIVADSEAFHTVCKDLDIRLAAIFLQAFEDCYNLESVFKFINMLGTLINRPIIRAEIAVKFQTIIDYFNLELDTVKLLYDEGMQYGVPLDKYYPKVAGVLLWLHKLRTRIAKPIEDFKILEDEIVRSEDAAHVFLKFDQMVEILDNEQNRVFMEWYAYVPGQIEKSMNKFELLRVHNDLLLDVNFDEELKAILREVKYMSSMEIKNIPEEAQELFQKTEELVSAIMKFTRIVEWYNYLVRNTTEYEYNIIATEMNQIDELMTQVTEEYVWATNDLAVVEDIYETVKQLYDRVKQAQANVNALITSINVWALQPLFERKDGKKENLLYIEDRQERVQRRRELISASSEELERIVRENYFLFFREPMKVEPTPEELAALEAEAAAAAAEAELAAKEASPESDKKGGKKDKKEKGKPKPKKKTEEEIAREEEEAAQKAAEEEIIKQREEVWLPYLQNLDSEIKELLMVAVDVSFYFFLKEMGDAQPITPLFELLMELHEPEIVYIPSADIDDPVNFHSFVVSLLEDVYSMGNYMTRVDVNEIDNSYYDVAKEESDILAKYSEICSRILSSMDKALQYVKEFDEYVLLWAEDRQEYLKQFLSYGRQLTMDELEQLKDETEGGLKETPPSIPQFKEQIDYYNELYKKVEQLPPEQILMNGWLRLDVRPLRQAILNVICKWGNLFKQHLYNRVIDSLEELEEFIKESIAAMQVPLTESDYEGLLTVMGYLFKVKERQLETDAMFDPLKEIMDLLKDYGVEFPEDVYVQLQEIPDRWVQCKKVAAATKQTVAPLQALQVNAIKRRINIFEIRQQMFREQFKKQTIFLWTCPSVYPILDKKNLELFLFEEERDKLQEQSNLFELVMPEFKPMKTTRKEIKQIKQLWDYVNIVRSCMDEWKDTPWKKIDVENMEMECKKFGKEIRGMDKELKGWDVYIQLEASIKNMLTSLRAVTELQNPAIRERHWTQLMQATKVEERLPPHYTVSTNTNSTA